MTALKDIGRIGALLGASPLSKSAIWFQPVMEIQPVQLFAFVERFSELGQRDMAETSIGIAQTEIQQAIARNEIGVPPMLSFKAPLRSRLTLAELKEGMDYIGRPRAQAMLFALETNLDAIGVAMLTYRKLALMPPVSEIARECLAVCPRHIGTPYVFWEERAGRPMPVFGLDAAVFEAFGLVWAEFAFSYKHLIQ